MKDGDRYVTLVVCSLCGNRWLQTETWGETWCADNCPECGGHGQTIADPTKPPEEPGIARTDMWAPEHVLLTWDEERIDVHH